MSIIIWSALPRWIQSEHAGTLERTVETGQDMKVSVALCTYNGARFLPAQLASIAAQTRLPDELILRDDGSSDDTLRIAQDFAATFPGRVDIAVNPERRGVTANFEGALRAATGGLVLLSDQDDVWHPDRVALALAAFDSSPELRLFFSDARLVDSLGEPLGETQLQALGMQEREVRAIEAGQAFSVFAVRNLPLGATMCVSRDVLKDALPIPTCWLHDEWLALIAAAKGRVIYLDRETIDYRQHGNNVLGAPPRTVLQKFRAIFSPKRDVRKLMLERDQALMERLSQLAVAPVHLKTCADKLEHSRVRSQLAPARLFRILPVLREVFSGRYQRCSGGWKSIVIDLLRPIQR